MELEVQLTLVRDRISLLTKRENYYRQLLRSQVFGKRNRQDWKKNMEKLKAASKDLSYLRQRSLDLHSLQFKILLKDLLG